MKSRLVIIGTLLLAVVAALPASSNRSKEDLTVCIQAQWRSEIPPMLRSKLTPAEKAVRLAKYVQLGDRILDVEARFGHPYPTLTEHVVKTHVFGLAYYENLEIAYEEGKVVGIYVYQPDENGEIIAQVKDPW